MPVIIADDQTPRIVIVEQANVVVVPDVGTRGPPGGGGGGGSSPPVSFAFDTASPLTLLTPASLHDVVSVLLQITEPFDGVGASLQVGTAATPSRFMAAGQNLPRSAGGYMSRPLANVPGGTPIILTINPGTGATDGIGRVVLTVAAASAVVPGAYFTHVADNSKSVAFTDASTSVNGPIVSWAWDFGDSAGTSTLASPSYTYAANGTYSVSLTVTDSAGASDTRILPVTAASFE